MTEIPKLVKHCRNIFFAFPQMEALKRNFFFKIHGLTKELRYF